MDDGIVPVIIAGVLGFGIWLGYVFTADSWEHTKLKPPCEHASYDIDVTTLMKTCVTYGCLDTKIAALQEFRGCK